MIWIIHYYIRNYIRKSLDEPRKSLDEPRKSLDEPRKSLDEPRKSLDEPRYFFTSSIPNYVFLSSFFVNDSNTMPQPPTRKMRSRKMAIAVDK